MLPGWEGKLTPGACARGGLARLGVASLHVSHPLSFSGFQNIQLFPLRAQDGKVKKLQGDFLIVYERILEVGFCEISDSGDTKPTTLV